MSIQTKEPAPALASLSKAKGNRISNTIAVVKPANNVMENTNVIESTATLPPNPAPTQTTSQPADPVPSHDGRGNYEDAYKNLKKHHDNTTHELRQRLAQLEAERVQAAAPKITAPKTKEEVAAFREQFKDAFDVIRTVAIEEAAAQNETLKEQLKEINKTQAELKDKEAFSELLREHPDALEIRSSPKFKEWYDEQPLEIQEILRSSRNIRAVSKQLSLYKLEVLGINPKEAKAAKTNNTLEASLGVNVKTKPEITSQKKIWTKSEIDMICADYKLWSKYRVEIDEARMEGRVDTTK